MHVYFFMDKELKNKVALVTGASSGIGAATSQVMAREGAKIAITYFKNEDGAKVVERSIKDAGGEVIRIKADVTNEDEVTEMSRAVAKEFGKIDILVNNAGGFMERRTLLESDRGYWQSVIETNLSSVILVSNKVVPHMGENGCIINVSSTAAIRGGGKGAYAYAASKGGVSTFSKALAKELSGIPIRVLSVQPGLIDTPFHAKSKNSDIYNLAKGRILLKRPGNPQEVGEVISFLASSRASFINGTAVTIDGGDSLV